MTDTSTADELPPQTNGIDNGLLLNDDERARMRPADIDADVREMERRKRVELIMNSKLFREELERIIETQLKDGSGTTGLLQQISDMVGVNKQAGNVFKSSSCVIPINDIRGIESMGYAKGEKILRCKLAAVFRLIDLYGWTQSANTLITARLNQEDEQFLVNPYGMLFHEITASSLIKVDMQGSVLEQGTTNFSVNVTAFSLHAAVHAARPDLRCIIHVHTPAVVAVSALKHGLLPLSQESVVVGEVSTHPYLGGLLDADEKDKLARNLGPINKVLLLSNQGALCGGETIEEVFFNARNTILASDSQLKLLPVGVDNLVLLNDEARKKIYDAAHKAPESSPRPDQPSILEGKVERKWRVGGIEFEALMRMMDNAGFRTGYIYRHPLIKGEPPKPRNDVEVPPAVSSLGYLLEEEELYRQGLWKKLEGGRKGHDRSRWLNSPNVYQKVEILETGTPDPKKITKWVAEASPSHTSTPMKIDAALQFVPQGTNPKEFKAKQQQIKDYRRADKISAGPQSHILEGVTWEEARKMQDAVVTQTGDHVVLMGAASKGIIQRGHQHNATVYKSPYAKNPFDCVTDEELEDYKKVVEKKAKGEYDTDYSESEGLSSAQINKRLDSLHLRSPTSVTSETEEESRDEPQILRIETTTAPKPSQPEVVLSDGSDPLTFNPLNPQHTISCYRTNSHAGLPKGSYIVPNPVHFHVVRITTYNQITRPIIQSIAKRSYDGNYGYRRNDKKSAVSLHLNDTHSVTVDISLESLKAFIEPFARALNVVEVPIFCHQTSQTSYMNNFERRPLTSNVEYTPLYVNTYCDTLHVDEGTSSFERQILNDMQDNLMFTESVEFNEEMGEGLADEIFLENGSGSSSNSAKTYVLRELANEVNEADTPYKEHISVPQDTRENLEDDLISKANKLVDECLDISLNYIWDKYFPTALANSLSRASPKSLAEYSSIELQSSEISSNIFDNGSNNKIKSIFDEIKQKVAHETLSNENSPEEQKSSEISSSIFENGSSKGLEEPPAFNEINQAELSKIDEQYEHEHDLSKEQFTLNNIIELERDDYSSTKNVASREEKADQAESQLIQAGLPKIDEQYEYEEHQDILNSVTNKIMSQEPQESSGSSETSSNDKTYSIQGTPITQVGLPKIDEQYEDDGSRTAEMTSSQCDLNEAHYTLDDVIDYVSNRMAIQAHEFVNGSCEDGSNVETYSVQESQPISHAGYSKIDEHYEGISEVVSSQCDLNEAHNTLDNVIEFECVQYHVSNNMASQEHEFVNDSSEVSSNGKTYSVQETEPISQAGLSTIDEQYEYEHSRTSEVVSSQCDLNEAHNTLDNVIEFECDQYHVSNNMASQEHEYVNGSSEVSYDGKTYSVHESEPISQAGLSTVDEQYEHEHSRTSEVVSSQCDLNEAHNTLDNVTEFECDQYHVSNKIASHEHEYVNGSSEVSSDSKTYSVHESEPISQAGLSTIDEQYEHEHSRTSEVVSSQCDLNEAHNTLDNAIEFERDQYHVSNNMASHEHEYVNGSSEVSSDGKTYSVHESEPISQAGLSTIDEQYEHEHSRTSEVVSSQCDLNEAHNTLDNAIEFECDQYHVSNNMASQEHEYVNGSSEVSSNGKTYSVQETQLISQAGFSKIDEQYEDEHPRSSVVASNPCDLNEAHFTLNNVIDLDHVSNKIASEEHEFVDGSSEDGSNSKTYNVREFQPVNIIDLERDEYISNKMASQEHEFGIGSSEAGSNGKTSSVQESEPISEAGLPKIDEQYEDEYVTIPEITLSDLDSTGEQHYTLKNGFDIEEHQVVNDSSEVSSNGKTYNIEESRPIAEDKQAFMPKIDEQTDQISSIIINNGIPEEVKTSADEAQALEENENDLVKHYTSFATESNDSITFEEPNQTFVEQSVAEMVNTFSSEFLKVVDDYDTALEVINEVRHILRHTKSVDEGIEVSSMSTNNDTRVFQKPCNADIDERVMKLAQVIKDFLIEQGFEMKELVIFPELVDDVHVAKLIVKLKGLHKELFPEDLNSEKRNELRIAIANYILDLLTADSRFTDDSGSSDNFMNISDKIFTISEYVSEILDSFFDSINNEEFSRFSQDLDHSIAKSTPNKKRVSFSRSIQKDEIVDIDDSITIFKKDSTHLSETLWIAISPSPSSKPPSFHHAKKSYVVVDDIPLRPPADLVNINTNEQSIFPNSPSKQSGEQNTKLLSPISEESRINLFDSNLSSDYEIKSDSVLSDDYEIFDHSDNLAVDSSSRSEIIDDSDISQSTLEVDDASGTLRSKSSEMNIVVCNEIKFYRTKTNPTSFSETSNIVFTTDVVINKSCGKVDDDDKENSGDWMGFEGAKF